MIIYFFIEIQNHGIADELKILPLLYRLSAELDIPLAATNDCHYISKNDAEMQCSHSRQRRLTPRARWPSGCPEPESVPVLEERTLPTKPEPEAELPDG